MAARLWVNEPQAEVPADAVPPQSDSTS
jgi:hypothetical protein